MKTKIITGCLLLLMVLGNSCEDVNEDIFYDLFVSEYEGGSNNLTAVIDGASVVEGIVNPYDDEVFFPDGKLWDGYSVRTTFLVYNSNGDLSGQETVYSDSFFDKVTITKSLSDGTYTVATIMDIVEEKTDHYWIFSNLSNLNSSYIEFSNYVPNSHCILAFNKQEIVLKNDKTLSISPSHLGALVVLYFSNVNTSTRYIDYTYDINPDTYNFDTEETSRQNSFYTDKRLDFENKYTGYYVYTYLLPNTILNLEYTLKNSSGTSMSNTRTVSFRIQKGQHKMLTIDVANQTSSLSSL